MTPIEMSLMDEIAVLKAAQAELMARLGSTHSAFHVEQTAHNETKAKLKLAQEALKRNP